MAAKARGVRFGRPENPLPDNFFVIYHKWKEGEISATLAARECGMSLSTFRYKTKHFEKIE